MQREDELALVVEEQRGRVALSQTELAQSHIEVDALRTKVKAFAGSYGMPGKPFGKYNPEP